MPSYSIYNISYFSWIGNIKEDSFKKKSPKDFSILGLVVDRDTQQMSVKGKPISFKSRAKGSIDITIRNPQEFSNFLNQGGFQRQHIASLVCQCFDPTFIFNSIYHNVARLVNRKIVKSVPNTMPITYKVKKNTTQYWRRNSGSYSLKLKN